MKKIVLFLIAAALTGCAAVKNDKNTAESVAENQETLEVSTGRAQGSAIGENRDFFIGADITEDTNIDGIDAEISFGAYLSSIDIHKIADSLENIEGYSNGKSQLKGKRL